MNENDLRRALDRSSTDVQPSRDRLAAARRTAAGRRRRRDAITAGIGGAAFSVFAVLGAVNLSEGPGGSPANETLNLAAEVEATSVLQVPAEQSESRPNVLVGAAASGRLVNIDAESGKTTSVIGVFKNADETGQLLGGLALSKDQRSVYFDVNDGNSCQPRIMQVPIDGGTPTLVVNGSAPAMSNDGRSLAYVRHLDCKKVEVIERVLANGEESVIGTTSAGEIAAMTWSPRDERIVVDVRYEDSSKNRLAIATTNEQSNLDAVRAIDASALPAGTVYEWPSFLPDGRVFVSERCCVGQAQGKPSSRLVILDIDKPKDAKVIAIGVAAKSHTSNASDASGAHLLYLSGQDLMVSDDGRRPSPISYGLLGATWK